MKKEMKPNRNYFIINIDEPYARIIYEVLKLGQIEKGEWEEGDISFEKWVELTFDNIDNIDNIDNKDIKVGDMIEIIKTVKDDYIDYMIGNKYKVVYVYDDGKIDVDDSLFFGGAITIYEGEYRKVEE